jgi:hypothetical protein
MVADSCAICEACDFFYLSLPFFEWETCVVNKFLHNLQLLSASNSVTKRIETIPRQRLLCPAPSDARKIKGAVMKMSRISTLLFGGALLFSTAALAGENNKGKLELTDKIVVDGKPIEPGSYRVEWDGSGPAVQVRLLQGKQIVATLSAHLTEQADRNSQDAYSVAPEPDGSKELTAIYPSGKRLALEFDHSATSTQSGN